MPDDFTYSGDPKTSDRDWVRWRIGDTNPKKPLQLDKEIDASLDEWPNRYEAAAHTCDAIAAKFAQDYDATISTPGASSITNRLSQRYDHYIALAKELREQGDSDNANLTEPYCGGISLSDKETDQDDADANPPPFFRGQFTNNVG